MLDPYRDRCQAPRSDTDDMPTSNRRPSWLSVSQCVSIEWQASRCLPADEYTSRSRETLRTQRPAPPCLLRDTELSGVMGFDSP